MSVTEIHAPEGQEVSSLSGQSQVYRLCETKNSSLQSEKIAQSVDSLETTPITDQTAQEEHRAATKLNQAQHMDLSLHKSLGARIQSQ